jgi:hypothetical protein
LRMTVGLAEMMLLPVLQLKKITIVVYFCHSTDPSPPCLLRSTTYNSPANVAKSLPTQASAA